MQTHHVQITLAAPPQLTSTDQWALLWSGLASQFPLHNLHWKAATRTSIRTIQVLDVNLVTLASVKDEGASQIPLSLLDKPVLNVFMVICEDNDTYKNTVKKQIKDWHSQVIQRKNQEWLILLVTNSDNKQTQTSMLKLRGTLLDRIRADFNIDKKDRCAQLTWSTNFKNPTIWAEFVSKIKDGIIAAFGAAVSAREEEVKRSEGQKTMPGWNFCTFFLLKESLAISFEGANLLEDALIQYEELEAAFFQVLKDRTLWFGKFIEPAPKDDSLPLLSITKKPYRDLILANTISVFDLRVYLLARQCSILSQLGRFTEVCRKVGVFVGAFGGRLREFQTDLPDFFVETWIYSSVISTIESCEEWAKKLSVDATSSTSCNAAKGELFEIARHQLDRLGVKLSYLPSEPPFTGHGDIDKVSETGTPTKRASNSISNADILAHLSNKSSFYDHYIRLTNKAIDLYVKANRRKFALKLHGSLAALDLHRQRLSTASQIFTSLPAHYAPHRWTSLESYMLFQSMETSNRLQNNHDRQWIHTAMSFLKAYVDDSRLELLIGVQDKEAYVKNLIESVIIAASDADADLVFQEQPMLAIHPVFDSGRIAVNQDGCFLDVIVENLLPCDLSIDEFILALTGRNYERVKFSAAKVTAKPGRSSLTLFCSVPSEGTFLLGDAEFRLGRLVLRWTFNNRARHRQSSFVPENAMGQLVKLPRDPRAVCINVEQPLNVEVGGTANIFVSLASGRNTLSRVFLRFSSPEVTIYSARGLVQGDNLGAIFSEEGVLVNEMKSDQLIQFFLPHSEAISRDYVKVHVELEYVTEMEPKITRKKTVSMSIPTSLDLTVNVQDFFRGEKLFTNFTISSTTDQRVRISSVELRSSENDKENILVHRFNDIQKITTATCVQPASFIFQLDRKGEVQDQLRLRIQYRLLRDEVEDLISRYLKKIIGEDHCKSIRFHALHDLIIQSLEQNPSWVTLYEITGQIHTSGFNIPGISTEVLDKLKIIPSNEVLEPANGSQWRCFTIPVDLPRLNILATTRVYLVANPFDNMPTSQDKLPHVYAGQPFTAVLSVNTSFYWSGIKNEGKQYRMRFEVEEMIKDWLISGQKRGDFLATDGSTHTVSITLMALRHGEIPLPKVLVSVVSSTVKNSSSEARPSLDTYQTHGAEKLLILPRGGRTTFLLDIRKEE